MPANVLDSRRKRLVPIGALAMLATVGSGAPSVCSGLDVAPLRPDRPPQFTADVVISLGPDGQPALAVTISAPYSSLQWIQVGNGYAAGAEFTVVFEPRSSGRLYGGAWERRLVVANFPATVAPTTAMIERRSYDLRPGRYQLRVQVQDLNSRQSSTASARVTVPDYSRVPVGFVDLELGVLDAVGTFLPLPTRRFGLNAERLAARVALFDRRPGTWPRVYPLRYRVRTATGDDVLSGRREIAVARSGEPILMRPDSTDLFIGSYVFEIELVEGRSRWRVDRSFEVEESGPPRGAHFTAILEALSLIADPDEIERLRSLASEEQARGWDEFWRRRDPTPDTPRNEALLEFLRRVRYAEQHFQSFGPGWRSDMGRIYIKFGAPDQIENRPATSQLPQLEIWYYNQPRRRFVFADREGFGRFVLVSPAIE